MVIVYLLLIALGTSAGSPHTRQTDAVDSDVPTTIRYIDDEAISIKQRLSNVLGLSVDHIEETQRVLGELAKKSGAAMKLAKRPSYGANTRKVERHPADEQTSLVTLNKKLQPYLYGGDILVSASHLNRLKARLSDSKRTKRGAALITVTLWDKTKPIGYKFDDTLANDTATKTAVKQAVANFEANTCLRFTSDTTVPAGLIFTQGQGCYSSLGQTGAAIWQYISLGVGCGYTPTAMHEMTHALGQDHTQTQSDRDNYVVINQQNIDGDYLHNYQKHAENEDWNFFLPYDYGSVMHYGPFDFSLNNQLAMESPSDPAYEGAMGQRRRYSFADYKLLNLQYDCAAACDDAPPNCQNGGFPNPNDCSSCICSDFWSGPTCETALNLIKLQADTPYVVTLSNTAPENSNFDYFNWDTYNKQIALVKAPAGKVVQYTIDKLVGSDYGAQKCTVPCPYSGVIIQDQDITIAGKTYCCANDAGTTVKTNSSLVAYTAYYPGSSYTMNVQITFNAV